MVNRGEEKVRVHMNVVPRSTMNTMVEQRINSELKCYVKPMKNPLGVSPSKGNQGTTRGKEFSLPLLSFDLGGNRTHDLRIRSTVTLPTELRGRTRLRW